MTDPQHASARQPKNIRRINAILGQIPAAREQLLVAIEDLAPSFDVQGLVAAAESADPRDRNKVAVIERQYEVLLNWLNELAARVLAEGQRRNALEKSSGRPWQRLADLGAISHRTAAGLQEAMELRDELGHAYPPAAWHALYEGVQTVLHELDRYVDRLTGWASDNEIIP